MKLYRHNITFHDTTFGANTNCFAEIISTDGTTWQQGESLNNKKDVMSFTLTSPVLNEGFRDPPTVNYLKTWNTVIQPYITPDYTRLEFLIYALVYVGSETTLTPKIFNFQNTQVSTDSVIEL